MRRRVTIYTNSGSNSEMAPTRFGATFAPHRNHLENEEVFSLPSEASTATTNVTLIAPLSIHKTSLVFSHTQWNGINDDNSNPLNLLRGTIYYIFSHLYATSLGLKHHTSIISSII